MNTISLSEHEAKIIVDLLREEKVSVNQALLYGDDDANTLTRSSSTLKAMIDRFVQVFGPFVQR